MIEEKLTFGDKLADKLANAVGTWTFIGLQATFITIWMVVNMMYPKSMDKYPFVFLNLLVGFESAFTAPVLLMVGNRQSKIDRQRLIEALKIDETNEMILEAMSEHFDLHFHRIINELEVRIDKTPQDEV